MYKVSSWHRLEIWRAVKDCGVEIVWNSKSKGDKKTAHYRFEHFTNSSRVPPPSLPLPLYGHMLNDDQAHGGIGQCG